MTTSQQEETAAEHAVTRIFRALSQHGHRITQAEGEDGLADAILNIIESAAPHIARDAGLTVTALPTVEDVEPTVDGIRRVLVGDCRYYTLSRRWAEAHEEVGRDRLAIGRHLREHPETTFVHPAED